MNRFERSFRLLSQSLAIIRRDRSLLWFPVLSATFTLIAVAIVLVPAAVLLLPGATADGAHSWPMLVVAGLAATPPPLSPPTSTWPWSAARRAASTARTPAR